MSEPLTIAGGVTSATIGVTFASLFLYGKYLQVDPGELMLNIAICIAVWRSRGNLAKVFQKAGQ
ncbi:TPA: phage holin family protein [Escherichia coli]|nr:phage holin family protein [Escherichia coli]